MISAKLENKDVEELTLNSKNTLGELIQYDITYFEKLERLETIALNGFNIDNDWIEKINCLKNLKTIIFNHCKFINDVKLTNCLENLIITYCDISNINIFEKMEKLKTLEMIGIEIVNVNNFIEMKKLEEIAIYNSKIKNSKKIIEFTNLKNLKLDGSLVDEEEFSKLLNKNIKFSYKEKYLIES